ncbi:Peroxygenase 2 isoform A [Glycine soja]|uniref:Peroxygenase 2 isoform A n=1 Tax=Glycine soja TaxID=3848 RepID=A0A445F7X2_GLYSO|nr:Peroxygenase 2 isoform A [Glycine soja]
MAVEMERESLITEAPNAPVTAQRRVRSDLENSLPKPWSPKWNNRPKGTTTYLLSSNIVLFLIKMTMESFTLGKLTWVRLRAIGFNVVASVILAVVINAGLSYPTQPILEINRVEVSESRVGSTLSVESESVFLSWFPSLLFPVYMHNIPKAKHGSDQEFMTQKDANIENVFSKYARTVPDKLTLGEVWDMTEGNRNAFDIFGWLAAKLEWGVLYILARDEEGFLSKEAVRRCFDGSLFD